MKTTSYSNLRLSTSLYLLTPSALDISLFTHTFGSRHLFIYSHLRLSTSLYLLTPSALDISLFTHTFSSWHLFIYSRAHIFKASISFTKFCDAVYYEHKKCSVSHNWNNLALFLAAVCSRTMAITERSGGSSWLRGVHFGDYSCMAIDLL